MRDQFVRFFGARDFRVFAFWKGTDPRKIVKTNCVDETQNCVVPALLFFANRWMSRVPAGLQVAAGKYVDLLGTSTNLFVVADRSGAMVCHPMPG